MLLKCSFVRVGSHQSGRGRKSCLLASTPNLCRFAFNPLVRDGKASSPFGNLILCLCQAQVDQIAHSQRTSKSGGQSLCW